MIICIGPSGSLRGAPRDEALSRAKRGNPWDCHALRARHDIFWSVEMVPISYSAIIYTQFPDFLEVKVPGLPDKKIAFPQGRLFDVGAGVVNDLDPLAGC